MHRPRSLGSLKLAVLSVLVLCVGLPTSARAEDPGAGAPATPKIERPFLWVFEGDSKVYLFGTVHLPASLTGAMPRAVTEAIAASDVFFGELSNEDLSKQGALVARLQNPPEKGLSKVLSPEVYERLESYLASKQLPVVLLERMKPWVIAVMLPLLDFLQEMAKAPAMDAVIGSGAAEQGKESGGLETVEEQLAIFEGLTDEEEVRYLEKALDDVEKATEKGQKASEELLDLYRSGDETKLAEYVAGMKPSDEVGRRLMERALDVRNVRMADRIVENATKRPGKTIFVYVGAAHLPGEKGVLALLEAKGWKARRVTGDAQATTPAEAPPKPVEKPVEEPAPAR